MEKNERQNTMGRFEIVCDKRRLLDHLKETGYSPLTIQDLTKSGFDVKDFGKDNLILSQKQFGSIKATKSRITMKGTGNILVIDGGVIEGSALNFGGSNSVCYISRTRHRVRVMIGLHNGTNVYLGKNMYINNTLQVMAAEHQSVFVGDDCLISHGVMIRTADPHLIYDCETLTRVNPASSVIVGDHVWIGQEVLILKGTLIGSGSIIGAKTVISGKMVNSNTVWAGDPARCIKKGVFFLSDCTNLWDYKQTHESIMQTKEVQEKYTFKSTKNLSFNQLDLVDLIRNNNKDRLAM